MKKLRRLFSTYKLRVDDRGRLKLPHEIQDALGEKRQVLVVSLLWQTVRIYPLGGSSRQRILIGKDPVRALGKNVKWTRTQSALLWFGGINYPIWYIHQRLSFVTDVDSQGRVVVAPQQASEKSSIGMENEDVRVRWKEDHFVVITDNREDWPDSLWWTS